jgi:hypothetical protein
MKKLFIAAIVLFSAFSAFAQTEDEYARFQGVWYAEMEDLNAYFIFENNTAIMLGSEDGRSQIIDFCNFMISSNKIVFYTKCGFYLDVDRYSGWLYAGPDDLDDDSRQQEADYIFSGDKLILIFDGDPWILSNMN